MIFMVLTTGCAGARKQDAPMAAPSAYQLLTEISLADRAHVGETLGQFTLEQTAVTGIHYAIQNIDTTYFKLSLVAENGTSYLILESKDYRTDENGGGFWQESLPPGTYHVVLSAPQSPGTVSVSWGIVDGQKS